MATYLRDITIPGQEIPKLDDSGKPYFVDESGSRILDKNLPQKPDELDFQGVADATKTIAASAPLIVPQMAGTLYGAGKEIMSGEFGTQDAARRIFEAGASAAEETASFIPGYDKLVTPSTEKGAEYLETINRFAERYLPPVIAGGATNVSRVGSGIRSAAPTVRELNERAFMGSTDAELATAKLDKTGILVRDPDAIDAIEAGFNPLKINLIKNASEPDRKLMRQMADIRQKMMNLGSDFKNRAINVPGALLVKRMKQVEQIRKEAGSELDKIVNSYFKGAKIDDIENVGEMFRDDLSSLGITVDRTAGLKTNFSNSVLSEGGDTLVKKIINRIRTKPLNDAADLHNLKRFIDNNINYSKQATGLDADGDQLIKRLRRNINEYLQQVETPSLPGQDNLIGIPENVISSYAQTNRKYAASRDAKESLEKFLGTKIDIDDPESVSKFGLQARGLISNRQAQPEIARAVRKVDEVIDQYLDPKKKDKNDLDTLLQFADALDETVGPEPGAGAAFRTQVARGTSDALSEVALAMGNVKGAALNKLTSGGGEMRKHRDKIEKLKKMRNLLTAKREMPENYFNDIVPELRKITYKDEVESPINDPGFFARQGNRIAETPRLAPPVLVTGAAGTVAADFVYDPESGEIRAAR